MFTTAVAPPAPNNVGELPLNFGLAEVNPRSQIAQIAEFRAQRFGARIAVRVEGLLVAARIVVFAAGGVGERKP